MSASSPGGASSKYYLTPQAESATALRTLDTALPNASLGTVLGDGNHTMQTCTTDQATSAPINPAATIKLCFDSTAEGDAWSPQGITTSGDFDGGDGEYGSGATGHKVIVVAEHDSNDHVRIAWIDYTHPANPTYRWVLLVKPTYKSGKYSYTYETAHAGGLVWLGDSLWVTTTDTGNVATTPNAIDIFDFAHMYATTAGDGTQIGLSGSTGYGGGYSYVMARTREYLFHQNGNCTTGTISTRPLCFSSLSLDKTTSPESIVASEYIPDCLTTCTGQNPTADGQRDVRYPVSLDTTTGTYSLALTSGRANPSAGYISHVANQQGVLSHTTAAHERWWISHSSGTSHGQLWYQVPNQPGGTSTCASGSTPSAHCWSVNPEALTYWSHFNQVWSVTETHNAKIVFGFPASALP